MCIAVVIIINSRTVKPIAPVTLSYFTTAWPRIKEISCSTQLTPEHEILNAHKYENIKSFSIYQAEISL